MPIKINWSFGDRKKIKRELAKFSDTELNTIDTDGLTPLLNAIKNKQKLYALELIQRGVNLETTDQDGNTALLMATSTGQPEVIAALINAGADIDAKNRGGISLEIAAITSGSLASIKQLLNAGAFTLEDLRDFSFINSFVSKRIVTTLLSLAIDRLYLDIVEFLLVEAKANVHGKPFSILPAHKQLASPAPLECALRSPHLEKDKIIHIALLLIKHGADVNGLDIEGYPLISLAAAQGYVEIVAAMLQKGANANAGHNIIVNISDPHAPNGMLIPQTPLMSAIRENQVAIVRMLITHGADVGKNDIKNPQTMPPLYLAVISNAAEITELLLQAGAKMHFYYLQRSPLNSALQIGNPKIAAALVYAAHQQYPHDLPELLRETGEHKLSAAQLAALQNFTEVVRVMSRSTYTPQRRTSATQTQQPDPLFRGRPKNKKQSTQDSVFEENIKRIASQGVDEVSVKQIHQKPNFIPKNKLSAYGQNYTVFDISRVKQDTPTFNSTLIMDLVSLGFALEELKQHHLIDFLFDDKSETLDQQLTAYTTQLFIKNDARVTPKFDSHIPFNAMIGLYADWWTTHARAFTAKSSIGTSKAVIESFYNSKNMKNILSNFTLANIKQLTNMFNGSRLSSNKTNEQEHFYLAQYRKILSIHGKILFAMKDRIHVAIGAFLKQSFSDFQSSKYTLSHSSYTANELDERRTILTFCKTLVEFEQLVWRYILMALDSNTTDHRDYAVKQMQEAPHAKLLIDIAALDLKLRQLQFDKSFTEALDPALDESQATISSPPKNAQRNPYMYHGIMLGSARKTKQLTYPSPQHFHAIHISPHLMPDYDDIEEQKTAQQERSKKIDAYIKRSQQKISLPKKSASAQNQVVASSINEPAHPAAISSSTHIATSSSSDPDEPQRLARKKKTAHVFEILKNMNCYLVGSAVISALRQQDQHADHDFVTNQIHEKELLELGFINIPIPHIQGKSFYRSYEHNIDITVSHDTSPDWMENDAKLRDFFPVYMDKEGRIISKDPNSVNDILNRILRINGSVEYFLSDPLRLLRAIKYLVDGFKPDETLEMTIRKWEFSLLNRAHPAVKRHFYKKFDEYVERYGDKYLDQLNEYGLLTKLNITRMLAGGPATLASSQSGLFSGDVITPKNNSTTLSSTPNQRP